MSDAAFFQVADAIDAEGTTGHYRPAYIEAWEAIGQLPSWFDAPSMSFTENGLYIVNALLIARTTITTTSDGPANVRLLLEYSGMGGTT